MTELAGQIAVVVGGSRGFGRGIAEALAGAGATVHVLARSPGPLAELARAGEGRIHTHAGDALDPAPRAQLLGLRPGLVVLNAGAAPAQAPLQEQTWEGFSTNWNSDVKIAFQWLGDILRTPLRPGSQVVVMSSGAALRGSPISGGYAGAKAAVRFLAQYAGDEASRAQLGIRFAAVLPGLTPATDLGRAAAAAYAARAGRTLEQHLAQMGPSLTPALVGAAVVRLVVDRTLDAHAAFTLGVAGLAPVT